MKKALISVAILLAVLAATATSAPTPYENSPSLTPPNRIDELVLAQLTRLNLTPANNCSDAVFVRRVFLDVIGTLPTGEEARAFLRDTNREKRRVLIDRLLERREFADYWAMKWSDVLRVKAEFPINLWPNAAQAYHRWIRASLQENKPYDQFARELLTSHGSNFRVGPVNFYRAMQNRDPEGIAQTVALTFMGERAEKWTPERLASLAVFFSQIGFKPTGEWKEEIVFFDPSLATNGLAKTALFPDGKPARFSSGQDPRVVFTDWLINPKNPHFNRNIVNRVSSWLLGRGIINEPDDLRPDNPPSNPELLAYLEQELVESGYDLKQLYRLILNSQTYQRSSIPQTDTPEAEANFAHYPLRRLEAEVLIDALNQITATTEKYTSAIPEPFTFIPEDHRAIALPDGSISSPFLELFGRPSRDTGLESERNNRPTAGQRLHLLNSSHVQRKLDQSRLVREQTATRKPPREMARGIYLEILSRYPTEAEWKAVEAYAKPRSARGREVAVDLAWALINSAEFLYRH
jgi:hypothetical protein